MALDPRTPVLVGVGVASQRLDEPLDALGPVDLMVDAVAAAVEDAGDPRLAAAAGWVGVPSGSWSCSNPAGLVAERCGAEDATTVLADVGVLQQTLLSDAARSVADGMVDIAIVCGGEARTFGSDAGEDQDVGDAATPDIRLQPAGDIIDPVEIERSLTWPVRQYAVMETALRHSDRLTVAEHARRLGVLWADFSRVAVLNPHAWDRDPHNAAEILTASPSNRMLSVPYTKLLASQWNVDQAAALVLCSVEVAKARGLDDSGWVFPLAAAESNHMVALTRRASMARCPGAGIVGRTALALAHADIDDVAHLDVYSCFASAVRIQAAELGLADGRPLTVTGGMTFAGGPLNNYVLQATARMAEVLRADPGTLGLVTSVSGMLTKQGAGLWSTRPPDPAARFVDVTAEVADATATVDLDPVYEGPATVAGYTVVYADGSPQLALAVCDTPGGRRAVAAADAADDPDLAKAMVSDEWCGRAVTIGPGAALAV